MLKLANIPIKDHLNVHISSAHISETCGFIFNKLGIQEFSVINFLIFK